MMRRLARWIVLAGVLVMGAGWETASAQGIPQTRPAPGQPVQVAPPGAIPPQTRPSPGQVPGQPYAQPGPPAPGRPFVQSGQPGQPGQAGVQPVDPRALPPAEAPPNDWPRGRQQPRAAARYNGRQAKSSSAREYAPRAVRPNEQPSAIWTLGVNLGRAPRGLRITRISAFGPAHRFGLETDDYILDVNGYVVGDYNGMYYPLARVLDFAADRSGWVELLIWNKRTFSEETMWVQLQRR